jgi:hypothetical protein
LARSRPTSPVQPRAWATSASMSKAPVGLWAITAWGLPCSRMRRVSARVSTPASPTTPREAIQASSVPEARQLASRSARSRKTAPLAEVAAPCPICSTSSRFTPTLPTWGKVKLRIWPM